MHHQLAMDELWRSTPIDSSDWIGKNILACSVVKATRVPIVKTAPTTTSRFVTKAPLKPTSPRAPPASGKSRL
jgi:hypothetical protein